MASADRALAVELTSVTKKFGRRIALDDVDLTVPTGSVYGLVGPNGSGKTSLLWIVGTLLRPTSGSVSVLGLDPTRRARAVRALVGVVPEQIGAYGNLRVEDQLRFYAGAYQVPAAQWHETIDGLLELTGLDEARQLFVRELSPGRLKQLSLARALIHDPQLLVLDEPAAGLDPEAQADLYTTIETLRALGKTILVSSHDLDMVESRCTHVAVMAHGCVVESGPVGDVCESDTLAAIYRRRSPKAAS